MLPLSATRLDRVLDKIDHLLLNMVFDPQDGRLVRGLGGGSASPRRAAL
jgi:hypothetical protein